MSGGIEQILRKIRENSNDESVARFLEELILEESSSQLWQWRDTYKKLIESYSEGDYEN